MKATPAQLDALRLAAKGQLRGGHGVAWDTLATVRALGWATPDNRRAVGYPYYDSITDAGRAVLAAMEATP